MKVPLLSAPRLHLALLVALTFSGLGLSARAPATVLVNNPALDLTEQNTQSGTAVLAFGSTILVGFNDSGSNVGNVNKFTGYSRSTDGGATFTDMGSLPNSAAGNGGFPILARNNATGRIYFATLPFNTSGIQIFRSDDNGLTFSNPVNATAGKTSPNRFQIAVDNAAGAGNGNLYVAMRDSGVSGGAFLFRSTDGGLTFGPSTTILLDTGNQVQSPSVSLGPNHNVNVALFDRSAGTAEILFRRSMDFGLTFGAAVRVTTLDTTGIFGDLGLTGIRSGTTNAAPFRTSAAPQLVTNPVNGDLYIVYDDNPPGFDRGDIYLSMSRDGGLTWSARVRINQDVTRNDQWQPTIAVTPDGTHLGIFWYDRQLDAGNNLIDYFGDICSISLVITCGPEFRITDASFLPEFGRDPVLNPQFMGDYDYATADNAYFYVAWGDNSGVYQNRNQADVRFARIAVVTAPATVPEPAGLLLLLIAGLSGACATRRRC